MKRWIIPGFFILISSIPAFAQTASTPDPAKTALAYDIYDLTQSSQSMAQRLQAVAAAVAQSMPKDDKAKDNVNAGMKVAGQTIEDLRPKIRDAWATAFSNHFSLSELQSIKDFYASPAGSKLLAEQPAISKEMLEVIMPEMITRMRALMPSSKKENMP